MNAGQHQLQEHYLKKCQDEGITHDKNGNEVTAKNANSAWMSYSDNHVSKDPAVVAAANDKKLKSSLKKLTKGSTSKEDAVLSFHKKYGRWPWIQVFDAAWENDWFRKEEQRCWLVDKARKGSIVRKENGNNFVPSELGKVEDVGNGRILLGVEVPKSCIVHLNTGFDSRNLETELILKCKKEWPDRTCNQVERAGNTDIQAKKLAARNGITYVQKKRVCAVMLVDLDRGINDGSIKLSPDRKKHIKDFMRLKKAWPNSMLDHDKISNY